MFLLNINVIKNGVQVLVIKRRTGIWQAGEVKNRGMSLTTGSLRGTLTD